MCLPKELSVMPLYEDLQRELNRSCRVSKKLVDLLRLRLKRLNDAAASKYDNLSVKLPVNLNDDQFAYL